MKVLLVIPAYNEEKNILSLIEKINGFKKDNPELAYEVDYMIINDGSTDGTEKLCREHHLNVINLIMNLGIGGAVQTGYLYADINSYDIAVQFDGDGQHDINSLPAVLEPIIEDKADFVVGSRFLEGTSEFKSTLPRRMGISYLSKTIHLFTRCHIRDPASGYRAANRKVLKYLAKNYPMEYPEPESLVDIFKRSFRINEVQVNMFERQEGTSSIHSWKPIYYMIKVSLAIIFTSFKRKVKN